MNRSLPLLLALCCCTAAAIAQTALPTPALPGASQTPQGALPASNTVARRPDENRPERPITLNLFDRSVELGLSYEATAERRRNYDLNSARPRDREVLEHELKVDARLLASDSMTLFAELLGQAERRKELSDGSARRKGGVERGQAWLLFNDSATAGWSLQIGRIAWIDRRSWWWDEDLDAARLSLRAGDWRLDTGVARELARVSSAQPGIDPLAKGLTRWFGHASYGWAPRHSVETFWLYANDTSGASAPGTLFKPDTEDPVDARMGWLGAHAYGEARQESGHRFGYRVDVAYLHGREMRTAFTERDDGLLIAGNSSAQSVRGHAWDLGAQWVLPGSARPTFSVGLAGGSGGADGATIDRNFRQTGLQENKGRTGGVKRFRYYGELLDPELSNLRIGTVGFGLRFLSNSSVELLLHQYRQQVASTRLAGSQLSEDPLGISKAIGREIDIFVAMRQSRNLELTLKLMSFRPGAAFAADRRDSAHGVEVGAMLAY